MISLTVDSTHPVEIGWSARYSFPQFGGESRLVSKCNTRARRARLQRASLCLASSSGRELGAYRLQIAKTVRRLAVPHALRYSINPTLRHNLSADGICESSRVSIGFARLSYLCVKRVRRSGRTSAGQRRRIAETAPLRTILCSSSRHAKLNLSSGSSAPETASARICSTVRFGPLY
jgi:hypothetical protein